MPWSASRASGTPRSACSARPRTASDRPTRSACSRWTTPGCMEVADPARAFLAAHPGAAPGSVVAPTMEGSRPILVEVQALVSPTGYGTPTRKASGLDPNRLSLLIAVLGPAGRDRARQPRRLRQPGRRPVRRRARAGPAGRARPGLVAAGSPDRAGHGRHRRGRAAGRAPWGRRPRATAARGGAAGVPSRARAAPGSRRLDRTDRGAATIVACGRPWPMRSRPRSTIAPKLVARPSRRC